MLYFTFSMDTRDIVIPILMAVAVIGIGGFIALAIREGRRQIRQSGVLHEDMDMDVDGDADHSTESDDGWTPPEPIAYPARVVDMHAVVGNIGTHKRPKTGTSFLVTFLTDDGERVEYPVPEELYVTLSMDQTGTLVILNDGFFDFGDGEEVEEDRDAEGI